MASGQKVHQRPTEIKTALHGVALPIHYSDLNAVLKPVYTQPWRLNWPCLGSAPPINILLFSQTCQLIFKREKLYSYKSNLSLRAALPLPVI